MNEKLAAAFSSAVFTRVQILLLFFFAFIQYSRVEPKRNLSLLLFSAFVLVLGCSLQFSSKLPWKLELVFRVFP